jgi:hypothetical protein
MCCFGHTSIKVNGTCGDRWQAGGSAALALGAQEIPYRRVAARTALSVTAPYADGVFRTFRDDAAEQSAETVRDSKGRA